MKRKRKGLKAIFLLCVLLLAFFGGKAFLKHIFPMDYQDEVYTAAEETGLEPQLLFTVIQVESGFDPNARSHAGAVGLMQMIPDAFNWIQTETHGKVLYGEEYLTDPQLNIYYGSRLLALLNNRYHNMETAVCAYNAGVGNVDSWLKNREYSQDGVTLSSIPYEETRIYRIKIFLVKKIYETLYDFS